MDQARSLRELAARSRPPVPSPARVIPIASGKGGVGKTSLAVNLGMALVKQGERVVLIDADLGLANVDILLGIHPAYNMTDVLAGTHAVQDVLADGPGGLRILAGGSGLQELAALTAEQLDNLIGAFAALDEAFDVVLVDTGAGIGPNVLSFALSSDEMIVVATPDPTSIADAYSVIKVVSAQRKDVRWRIVINLAPSRRHAQATFRRLETVSARFLNVQLTYLGGLPDDALVSRATRQQEAFVLTHPNAPASRAVAAMASRLTGAPEPRESGLSAFVRRVFGRA